MKHEIITQRIVDAAALILTAAADRTEQTGCQTTPAFASAETRTAETYLLTAVELAQAARLATSAAFTTGAYTINAMIDPDTRTAALRNAINHIHTYRLQGQPCSKESERRLPEPQQQTSPTRQKTSDGSARHSAPRVGGWPKFASCLSRASTAFTRKLPDVDHRATTA